MTAFKEFSKGLWKENPVFVMMLGICPTLATTNSLINAFCMGLAIIFTLTACNAIISIVRKIIPDEIRIPCYIVIIASLVTIVDLSMHAFLPNAIYEALGIFIPLIVVNCIILGRAEAFAAKNNLWLSILDGLGMGIGFCLALCMLGAIREFLGNGTLLNYQISIYFSSEKDAAGNLVSFIEPISVFSQPAGAFLVVGGYLALFKYLHLKKQAKQTALEMAEKGIKK